MFNETMYKQMVDFQKATFDNTFNAMIKMQEQGEAMMNVFLNQAAWLPDDGKKIIKEYVKSYQTARDEFQKTVTDNFKTVENYAKASTDSPKTQAKKAS